VIDARKRREAHLFTRTHERTSKQAGGWTCLWQKLSRQRHFCDVGMRDDLTQTTLTLSGSAQMFVSALCSHTLSLPFLYVRISDACARVPQRLKKMPSA